MARSSLKGRLLPETLECEYTSFGAWRLNDLLDADWRRLHEFGGVPVPTRRFKDNLSPRFVHIFLIRLAQRWYSRGWRRAAKLPSLANVILFGLEVPARLVIGPGLVMPHTNGTVVGAGQIGRNCTIFHQVTLGATLADFAYDPNKRPTVGHDVTITAGAKVLGGISIGDGATIGANAVVLVDVPEGALAVGIPAIMKFPASA